MQHYWRLLAMAGFMLFAVASSSPLIPGGSDPQAVRQRDIATHHVETVAFHERDIEITTEAMAFTLTPIVDPDPESELSAKAVGPKYMDIVVCTDSPIYYGNCMGLQLNQSYCVDFVAGRPWDNSISSIEVTYMDSLCMVYQEHLCGAGESMWLNMGSTSRDLVNLTQYNDRISSMACYFDIRGVNGTWESF